MSSGASHSAELSGLPLLDKREAARLLGVSLSSLERLRRQGVVPAIKLGSLVRFDRNDLLGAMEANRG